MLHGFPGIGLVGTIASEFLLEHLQVEQIGKITVDEMPAMVAIHDNKLVNPFEIFYNKKYNIVIVHAIAATQGYEWKLADMVIDLSKRLCVSEIISLEGVAGNNPEEFKSFFYARLTNSIKKMEKAKIAPLKEGIIIGVTGAMLLKSDSLPITAIFSETHSSLPDSKAAAKIIETLDKYLGLKVNYKPLLAQAEGFEKKLQDMLKKGNEAVELSEKKRLSYVG